MTTLTPNQLEAIRAKVWDHEIGRGLGTPETACSIASINLALTGHLTDEVPACMSEVIGRWVIYIQDGMPATMRNGAAWRDLLPAAAGTGRAHERARLDIILDWLFDVVLPVLQPLAEKNGLGAEWQAICARSVAVSAGVVAACAPTWEGSSAAEWTALALNVATNPGSAEAAARAAAHAAVAVAQPPAAADRAAAFWSVVNPPGLLSKLVNVTDGNVTK